MKKKRMPTRRRTALRRVVIAAAVMVLVNQVLHIGLVLPGQALREMEERAGIGRTAVIARDRIPSLQRTGVVYLSGNDRGVMLSTASLSLFGWMPGFGEALDCTGSQPLWGGWYALGREEEAVWYYFGRVDDPAIETVEVCPARDEGERPAPALPPAELLEKDGRRYFLVRSQALREAGGRPPVVIGRDGAGRERARIEAEQGRSVILG